MRATYTREKGLNVRKAPSTSADVVRVMKTGESAEVEHVTDDGWAKIADGYVMVRFVEIEGTAVVQPVEVEASGAEAAAAATTETADADKLEGMTVKELRELAKQSGIELASGLKKAGIIEAILNA